MINGHLSNRRMPVNLLLTCLHFWPLLRIGAVLTLALVLYSMAVDANTVLNAFKWVTVDYNGVTWDAPLQAVDHYRIEVEDTDLMAEPVVTSLRYKYSKKNLISFNTEPDHSYRFRVQGVSPYGAMSGFSVVSDLYICEGGEYAKALADARPVEFALSQNYPNPFNSRTTISYQVPGSGAAVETTITIYNILGQNIRELVHEHAVPGQYSVVWDGLDSSGNQVSSGHYIYAMAAGKYRTTKKMILMK